MLCIFKIIYYFIVFCKDVNFGKKKKIDKNKRFYFVNIECILFFFIDIVFYEIFFCFNILSGFCCILLNVFFLFCIFSKNKIELSWVSCWIGDNLLIFLNNFGFRLLNIIKIVICKL